MLFLKRCADEFEAAYQREYRDRLERTGDEGKARDWAENPVPEPAIPADDAAGEGFIRLSACSTSGVR
ncbi:MAG: hypothetical protein M3Z25_15500 [Actinomycetota bacterium]|nr:hypothetical protein [Actinomycetota bacterium]